MIKKKRWFALSVLLVLTMVLAVACGKKTVDPPEAPQSEETQEETEAAPQQSTEQTKTESENDDCMDQLIGGSAGTVNYAVNFVEKQYEAEDGTAIFKMSMAYPIFEGEEEGVMQINRFYQDWSEQKVKEYEEDEDSTRQSALEVYRESRDAGWPGPWTENYEVSSVKTWNGYVSVLMDSYLYEGGAHGMPYREGHVFRLSDGQEVELADLTNKDQGEWDKILRARFADRIAQGEEAEFFEDALESIKVRDMKDVGYYFTETGIAFYLPPYEVGPYSTGYVEVEVPFDEIV